MKTLRLWMLMMLIANIRLTAQQPAISPYPFTKQQDSVYVQENYTKIEYVVEMRDGVKLFTQVYAPKDTLTKHPILMQRTPYSCQPNGISSVVVWDPTLLCCEIIISSSIKLCVDGGLPKKPEVVMGGYQQLIRSEILRDKFSHNVAKPEPFVPNVVTDVKFDLQDVLHTFKKGHKIMVQIQSPCFPWADRNPQKFMDIFKAKPSDY